MTSVEKYSNLCRKINEIINRQKLKIRIDTLHHESSVIQYDFIINNENSIAVTKLTSFYTEGEVLKGVTRKSYSNLHTQNIFNITWLFTCEEYAGRKLALLILIYSICYLKQLHLNTNYVMLDDDSDNNCKIKKNLYNKVGFVYRDLQSLASYDMLHMSGPEKQILLDDNFIIRITDILSNIENPNVKQKGGKKYTLKELKNIALRNKIKITKKIDEKTLPLNKIDLSKKLKRYKLL
jgi:hypothetical protein